ncbi:cytidine deaminase [Chakrabartyella piscis]|uniref:cytidine deaminase n=1 Tax=Chakrabartyella piscis TaxID=2918914 RepID=UPI002958886C|nr:cytidine deaminase [Chakrabartyella piscis]
MTNAQLMDLAKEARNMAYAPYSHFLVGAAILAEDGRVFTGCNVENASYGGTICAERTAAVKAVSEGCKSFKTIAVATSSGEWGAPCGLCRQFLYEFMPEGNVLMWDDAKGIKEMPLKELLPMGFRGEDIK